MNWETILVALWTFANSSIGVTAIASVALWAINKLYTAKPEWQAYEGAIIKAIQIAEREIPDEMDNKHIKRADLALQTVLKTYERMNGQRASVRTQEQLAQGIEIVHTDLESAGVL